MGAVWCSLVLYFASFFAYWKTDFKLFSYKYQDHVCRYFLLLFFPLGPVPVMYSVTTVLCFSRLPDFSPLYFICAATETGCVGVFPYLKPPNIFPVPKLPGHAVNIFTLKEKAQ